MTMDHYVQLSVHRDVPVIIRNKAASEPGRFEDKLVTVYRLRSNGLLLIKGILRTGIPGAL